MKSVNLMALAAALLVLGCSVSAQPDISLGSHGEGLVESIGQQLWRRNLQQEAIASGNGRPPSWRSRFDPIYRRSYIAPAVAENKCDTSQKCVGAMVGMTYPYEEYIMDPTATVNAQPVIRVWYPKGSWSPNSPFPGGTLFYNYPFKNHPSKDMAHPISAVSAALEYEVYFPSDFDFVKGGKLPGLSGGANNGRGCGGGADPAYCFSFRIMWRKRGQGEAYLYVPEGMQAPDFCSAYPECSGNTQPCTECNLAKGVSFGRGTFMFQRGQWNRVYMNLTLNTPNVTNGIIEIRFNGQRVLYYDKINWRQTDRAKIEGQEFSTWFGGSDATWGPPKDTYTMFRNFKLWRDDQPADITQEAVMQSLPEEQVLLQEVMDVGG